MTRASGGASVLDSGRVLAFVERVWDESVTPCLSDYIRIPARSPMFDPEWREHGHLDRAVALVEGWCRAARSRGSGWKWCACAAALP